MPNSRRAGTDRVGSIPVDVHAIVCRPGRQRDEVAVALSHEELDLAADRGPRTCGQVVLTVLDDFAKEVTSRSTSRAEVEAAPQREQERAVTCRTMRVQRDRLLEPAVRQRVALLDEVEPECLPDRGETRAMTNRNLHQSRCQLTPRRASDRLR